MLNIVVNNAGVIAPAMFAKMTADQFRLVLDVHLGGTFTVSQAALPFLPDDGTGRIINVTSAAGLVGTIGQANYGAAKAAIVGMTKSLARELARRKITVNAVAPLAATPMTENIRSNEKLAAHDPGPNTRSAAGPNRTRSHPPSSSSPPTPPPTSPARCCRSTAGRSSDGRRDRRPVRGVPAGTR